MTRVKLNIVYVVCQYSDCCDYQVNTLSVCVCVDHCRGDQGQQSHRVGAGGEKPRQEGNSAPPPHLPEFLYCLPFCST